MSNGRNCGVLLDRVLDMSYEFYFLDCFGGRIGGVSSILYTSSAMPTCAFIPYTSQIPSFPTLLKRFP